MIKNWTPPYAIAFSQVFASWLGMGLLNAQEPPNYRKPASETETRFWLENMVWYHRFTTAEITAATGLGADEVKAALEKFGIRPDNKPKRPADAPLLTLPY